MQVTDDPLASLLQMGFEEQDARLALTQSGNSLQRAMDLLCHDAGAGGSSEVAYGPSPAPEGMYQGNAPPSSPSQLAPSPSATASTTAGPLALTYPGPTSGGSGVPLTKAQEEEQIAAALAASQMAGHDTELQRALAASAEQDEQAQMQAALHASASSQAQTQALLQQQQASSGLVSLSHAARSVAEREDAAMQAALVNSAADTQAARVGNPSERVREDSSVPVGLRNLGNTCYVNSLLQAYARIPGILDCVLQYHEPSAAQVDAAARTRVGSDADTKLDAVREARTRLAGAVEFVLELQKLFARLLISKQRYADAAPVLEKLRDDAGKAVMIGRQEDISEFNMTFLARLEDAMHAADEGGNDASAAPGEPRNKATRLFFGEEHSVLAPLDQMSFEPVGRSATFSTLHVRIDGSENLYDCVNNYCAPEAVPDYEAASGVRTDAYSQTWFTRIPPVLTVALPRAQYDRARGSSVKVQDALAFPTRLIMDRYMRENESWAMVKQAEEACIQMQRSLCQERLRDLRIMPGCQDEVDVSEMLTSVAAWIAGNPIAGDAQKEAFATLQIEQACQCMPVDETPPPEHSAPVELTPAETAAVELLRSRASYVSSRVTHLSGKMDSLIKEAKELFDDKCDFAFRLHAVLVHRGFSAQSGHYWSFIHDPSSGQWHKFNDAAVTLVSEADVMRESVGGPGSLSSAYCLLYLHENTQTARVATREQLAALVPPHVASMCAQENLSFDAELVRWHADLERSKLDATAREITELVAGARDEMEREINQARSSVENADPCLLGLRHWFWLARTKRAALLLLLADVYELRMSTPLDLSTSVGAAVARKVFETLLPSNAAQDGVQSELTLMREHAGTRFTEYCQLAHLATIGADRIAHQEYMDALPYLIAVLRDEASHRYASHHALLTHLVTACVSHLTGAMMRALDSGTDTSSLTQVLYNGVSLARAAALCCSPGDPRIEDARSAWLELSEQHQVGPVDANVLRCLVAAWCEPGNVGIGDIGPLPSAPSPLPVLGRELMLQNAAAVTHALSLHPPVQETLPGPPRGFA